MADSTPSTATATATATSPSHAYISETWDAAIDTSLRKLVYGPLAGAAGGLILCRGGSARAAVTAFGAGFGAGSAYHENQALFDKALKG